MTFPQHPDYAEFLASVQPVVDAFKGAKHVKSLGTKYLPALPSMILDGMGKDQKGLQNYDAYVRRAVFPDFVFSGVETLAGILESRAANITVPEKMMPIVETGSYNGTNLQSILSDLHWKQLEEGRCSLVVDLPETADATVNPYMTVFPGISNINWNVDNTAAETERTKLAVYAETRLTINESLEWTDEDVYRVIRKDADGDATVQVVTQASELGAGKKIVLRGKPLKQVPVFFVNAIDNDPTPVKPPMSPLAELCFSIYMSEADYRQNLYMQGQDTLVVIGARAAQTQEITATNTGSDIRTGTGAAIELLQGGDAKYIGVNSSGLPEQRQALEKDYQRASQMAGQLITPGKTSLESGEALKTRVAAQTATLASIAKSAANALEMALKMIARWMGEDESKVRVEPNLDFTNVSIQGQDLVQLITAKKLGYPISMEQLHEISKRRGLTNLSFDEIIEQIKNDPEVLKLAMETDSNSLTGNNPTQVAGGPQQSTRSSGQQTNVPVERQGD